jgi:calcineurin-like phosphoesterase family protein
MELIPTHVISDTHFNHVRLPLYEPMRLAWGPTHVEIAETMIAAWNAVVGEDDVVLHLGDFAMGHPDAWPALRARLRVRIYLVQGNHDRKVERWMRADDRTALRWAFDHPRYGRCVCRHNPAHFTWEDAAEGRWLLHGHVHSSPPPYHSDAAVAARCRCASVEVLPGPGPRRLDEWLAEGV